MCSRLPNSTRNPAGWQLSKFRPYWYGLEPYSYGLDPLGWRLFVNHRIKPQALLEGSCHVFFTSWRRKHPLGLILYQSGSNAPGLVRLSRQRNPPRHPSEGHLSTSNPVGGQLSKFRPYWYGLEPYWHGLNPLGLASLSRPPNQTPTPAGGQLSRFF